MTQNISRDKNALNAWLGPEIPNYNRRQVTRTIYDVPNTNWSGVAAADIPVSTANLRNRVSYSQYYSLSGPNGLNYTHATYYSYDIHGNVDTLVQDYGHSNYQLNLMNNNGYHNRFKKTVYQYDLISGKVNHVAYQPQYVKGASLYRPADALYHKYSYDAENRIIGVYTSLDSVIWEKDASYDYYKHGPLARTELGEQRVQGIDYMYTIQGWLKGVNSSSLAPDKDMGKDGLPTDPLTQYVGRDEYGFSLNYFKGDYSSIATGVGNSSIPFHTIDAGVSNGLNSTNHRPLYNGNISSMLVNIGKLSMPDATGSGTTKGAVLYNYNYDQLNRLVAMDAYKGLTAQNNSWENMISLPHYQERISYDGNGNILTYKRNGNKTSQQQMDDLAYVYNFHTTGPLNGKLKDNRLKQVTDAVTNASAYSESDILSGVSDIETQAANNYAYDSIGNLIKDTKENITSINWNVYGKIMDINFSFIADKPRRITYTYDAGGNRIGKRVEKYGATSGATTTSSYTGYSRDASGNVMAVYNGSAVGTGTPIDITVGEVHLYGSSRLGVIAQNKNSKILPAALASSQYTSTFTRGDKFFELTNHLGNVLATISDKKIGVDDGAYNIQVICPGCPPPPFGEPSNCPPCTQEVVMTSTTPDGILDYYTADVITANDYYPGGMQMPGRKFSAGSQYRYGFNGKELDRETAGITTYDYGFRVYSPGLGRFLSVDPLFKSYPWLTPYQYASNNPIYNIDLDGLEGLPYPVLKEIEQMEQGWNRTLERVEKWTQNKKEQLKDGSTQAANAVVDATAISQLVQAAIIIDPSVVKYTEEQKQQQFQTNHKSSVSILLYEFATGGGNSERKLSWSASLPNSFANKFIEGRVFNEVVNELYDNIVADVYSYQDHLSGNIPYSFGLEFSPDDTKTYGESLEKHLNSNLAQFFIGGANVSVTPVDASTADVTITNFTSRNSLMLHQGKNYPQEKGKDGNRTSLSTTSQEIKFRIANLNPSRTTGTTADVQDSP